MKILYIPTFMGECPRRLVKNYETTLQLLRHNKHLSYVSNIKAVFKSFSCPNSDNFFSGASNLEQNLIESREWVNNIYPRNVYQTKEIHFEKLDCSGSKHLSQQKLFRNFAMFEFVSTCVQE